MLAVACRVYPNCPHRYAPPPPVRVCICDVHCQTSDETQAALSQQKRGLLAQMYVQHLAPVGIPAPSLLFFIPMAMPRNVE